MNKFITVILCAMMLSSCALLDKIRSDRLEVATPPTVENIRG
jgi:hypothetical protein